MEKKIAFAQLVIAAGHELETTEVSKRGGPYDRLTTWSRRSRRIRVNVAVACYLFGTPAIRGSRAFDNCFEAGDGKEVVAELTKRADENPELHRAIAADFGGTFPASWRANADREPTFAF